MISLRDGLTTDLLPNSFSDNPQMVAVAYAIQQEKKRLLDEADGTRTQTVIDELPEKILDVLATELRTPYYKEDMTIDVKRDVIKKTLSWHTKAGTGAAVEELATTVFGEGKVVEWFEFNGEPGTFDIITNASMTPDMIDYFLQIISRVKNTRSHLRQVLIDRQIIAPENVVSVMYTQPNITIA